MNPIKNTKNTNASKIFLIQSKAIPMFAAILMVLGTISTAKAEYYIQGAYGFGMVDDLTGSRNGVATSSSADENPSSIGLEFGMDRMAIDPKIRVGVGYQAMEIEYTDGTNLDATIYSANAYYFIGEKLRDDEGLHPYVGAGILLADYGDDDMKYGIALHAGADYPVNEDVSVGGKYTYLNTDGPSGQSTTPNATYSNEGITGHIFAATATYRFQGGM